MEFNYYYYYISLCILVPVTNERHRQLRVKIFSSTRIPVIYRLAESVYEGENTCSISVSLSRVPQQCSLRASLLISDDTCYRPHAWWTEFPPDRNLLHLQMQLNDIQYLEAVHRYENFDRVNTGMKLGSKKKCWYSIPAHFEHWVCHYKCLPSFRANEWLYP
jgi:hypothetical protein